MTKTFNNLKKNKILLDGERDAFDETCRQFVDDIYDTIGLLMVLDRLLPKKRFLIKSLKKDMKKLYKGLQKNLSKVTDKAAINAGQIPPYMKTVKEYLRLRSMAL
jgi:hypothetical protein